MSTLVDCHVHVGSRDRWIPEGLQLAEDLAAPEMRELLAADGTTGERLLAYLDSQGVDVAVVIPSSRDAVQEYTLDEAVGTDRILPFVQYDPRSAPEDDLPKSVAVT